MPQRCFDRLTYKQVITDQSGNRVMDMTAISLSMERKIPILVFNLKKLREYPCAGGGGEQIGTLISVE